VNVEIYSYSLFTTVLGMLVVFLSLTALSAMMVVLKAVFSERRVSRRTKKRRARVEVQPAGSEAPPTWLAAAVAAYLAQEEKPERPTADPWNAVMNQYDPWISGSRHSKTGV